MATVRRSTVIKGKPIRRCGVRVINRRLYPPRSFTTVARAKSTRTRTATIAPVLVFPVANDERTGAIDLTSLFLGTFRARIIDFDNTVATINSTDPAFIKTGYNSIWYKWSSALNGSVTFVTGPSNSEDNTAPYIETLLGAYTWNGSAYTTVQEDDDTADVGPFLDGSSRLVFTVTPNTIYYIAVASETTTRYVDVSGITPYGMGPGYLAWNFDLLDSTISPDQIVFTPAILDMAPAIVTITVSELNAGATVTATLASNTIGTAVVDDTGVATISALIPDLDAGTYTITVTQNSPSISGTDTLTVLFSQPPDSLVSDSTPPVHIAQKWRFYDTVGGTFYDFEINPDTYETPFPERELTTLVTIDVDGQSLVFEGNIKPPTWKWQGWIKTQSQYDAFITWYAKRRRIVLYDHLGRTCIIALSSFDPQPMIKGDSNPYLMRYTMTAIMYSVS